MYEQMSEWLEEYLTRVPLDDNKIEYYQTLNTEPSSTNSNMLIPVLVH